MSRNSFVFQIPKLITKVRYKFMKIILLNLKFSLKVILMEKKSYCVSVFLRSRTKGHNTLLEPEAEVQIKLILPRGLLKLGLNYSEVVVALKESIEFNQPTAQGLCPDKCRGLFNSPLCPRSTCQGQF